MSSISVQNVPFVHIIVLIIQITAFSLDASSCNVRKLRSRTTSPFLESEISVVRILYKNTNTLSEFLYSYTERKPSVRKGTNYDYPVFFEIELGIAIQFGINGRATDHDRLSNKTT